MKPAMPVRRTGSWKLEAELPAKRAWKLVGSFIR